jgi:glycosyltransferase (activator-dependent family)
MRILFLTVANKSHIYVPTTLAWALRTAGHEVCVVSDSELADVITSTGLTGATVGAAADQELTTQMNEADPTATPAPLGDPPQFNPVQTEYAQDDPVLEFTQLVHNLFPVMNPDAMIDDLVAFAQRWRPDLVIWDMLCYGGPVAARAVGAAHARLPLATDGIGQLRAKFLQERKDPDEDPLRDWLQPKLAKFGADFAEDVVLGDWTIDPMPSWTYHPDGVHFVPMRHIPFNGAAIVPDWVHEPPARPRVCITLGNSHRDAGRVEASAKELITAVADLDIEVIATFSAAQLRALPAMPDNVRAMEWVPLNQLLPTCSALVHHGGAGTFVGAVEHGVPQLLVPSTWWSEKWYGPVAMANGVQEQGAGLYVSDSDWVTADRFRECLVRVLDDPSFRANAERLRNQWLGMPTPNELVPTLERLTAQHRRTRQPA